MAVTPNYSWPVPVATDYVKNGYEAIADLGDAIDATVFALPSGGISLISTTSFSAVSSQSISTVFSATYKNYFMNFNMTNSANTDILLRLRSGSTDATGANYSYGSFLKSLSTASLANDGQAYYGTSFPIGYNMTSFFMQTKLFNPFGTNRTTYDSLNVSNVGNGQTYYFGGIHDLSTSYNGFTFYPTAGTMTGSVSVYGYGI